MPQSGFTPIITYNTATASAAPSAGNLTQGELAVNVTDKKIYTKNSGGSVVQVGSGPDASETLTNKTLTSPDINGGTIDGAAIGSTTPAAGSFTTLSASGAVTIPGSITTNSDLSVVKTTVDDTGIVVRNPSASGSYPLGKVSQNGATGSGITSWPNAMVVEGQATGGLVLGGYVGDLVLQTGRADRMRIANATGAVTIPGSLSAGATSVTTLSASDGLTITKNGPTARALTIKNDSLNINEYAEIHFQNSGSDVIQSSIRSVRDTSGSFGTSLQFLTENDFTSGEAVRMTLSGSGAVTIPGSLSLTGGTLGYGTGAGGTVTQATSKSTAVTLNKPSGQITMNNEALAAGATIYFNVQNSLVAATDTIVLSLGAFAGNGYNYQVWPFAVVAGSFYIAVRNISAGSLSDSVAINFAIIKGSST